MIQDDMITEAKKLVGVPFKDKGRDEFGLDCAGLLILVAHRLGLSDYDTLDYPHRPNEAKMRSEMKRIAQIEPIPNKWSFKNGDLGVFSDEGFAVHLGFLEIDDKGKWFIIHAWARARKVVRTKTTRDSMQNYMHLKLRRVYRYTG